MSDALLARLEAAVARIEAAAGKIGGGSADVEEGKSHPMVTDYQDYYQSNIVPFVATCAAIPNDEVKNIGKQAEAAFKFLGTTIEAISKSKKPSNQDLMKFVDPIVKVVTASQNADNRSDFFPFTKSFSEAIGVMNWLFIPAPAGHVSSCVEAAEFYLNKILLKAKDADDNTKKLYRAYVSQTKDYINNLAAYVKQHHKMGPEWNNVKGAPLSEFKAGGAPSAPAAPAAPPAPPAAPAAPAAPPAAAAAAPAAGGGGMGAVFKELSKGLAVTSGLKKVTSDMKTKNLKDKPALAPKKPVAAPKAAPKKVAAAKKPPTKVLRQGTWFVENYEGETLDLEDVQMKQNVYIYNANKSTITIKGKVKSITVDKCTKSNIVFDAVVSTFEVIGCKSIRIFAQESVPSVLIDKSDATNVILNEKSFAVAPSISTCCATETNITIPKPGGTPEDDPVEMALSESFMSQYKDGAWVTEPIKHSD